MSFGAIVLAIVVLGATRTIVADVDESVDYLHKYGYLTGDDARGFVPLYNVSNVRNALLSFQRYYGIAGDGALNAETLRYMRKPRCGVRDILDRAVSNQSLRWPKRDLTWNFYFGSPSIMELTQKAFDMWAEHVDLTFTRVNGYNPDIMISFQQQVHPNVNSRNERICNDGFDGPGAVVAHATIPTGTRDFPAEIHVDAEETWHMTLDQPPSEMTGLFEVLVHEIGHALGLPHNSWKDSVMYAYVIDKEYPLKLSKEDIASIRNLYGSGDDGNATTTTTSTTTTTTTIKPMTTTVSSAPNMDLCTLTRVDAILVANRRTYVMYDKYIWSVSLTGQSYSRPKAIVDYLAFLPRNTSRITAIYQQPSGDIMLFANNMVYAVSFPDLMLRAGWPKSLTVLRLPANARVQAALSTNTGRTFIIYNEGSVGEIDERYMFVTKHSALEAVFPGIPSKVSSAFRYINGNLYFLAKRGRAYYEYNEFTGSVTRAGTFDLSIINTACPNVGLLQRLRDLVQRIAAVCELSPVDDDDEDADDDAMTIGGGGGNDE